LKGFGKVNLKPGESGKIEMEIGVDSLGYYDDRKVAWIAEKGEYHVLIGASSTDIRLKGVIKNEQEVKWTGLGI
jgi:beta-glucosidase